MISKTGEAVGGLTITVEIPRLSYRAGESILLKVTLKNVGQKELRFRQSTPYAMYDIMVKTENGTEIPKTRFGQKHAWGAAFPKSFLTLGPGEEHSVSLPISRLFDMTLAGKYSIVVSKKIPTQDSGAATVFAPSFKIRILDEAKEFDASKVFDKVIEKRPEAKKEDLPKKPPNKKERSQPKKTDDGVDII